MFQVKVHVYCTVQLHFAGIELLYHDFFSSHQELIRLPQNTYVPMQLQTLRFKGKLTNYYFHHKFFNFYLPIHDII